MRTVSTPISVPLKRSVIFTVIMLIAAAGSAQSWTPDAATIAKLESSIKPGDIHRQPGRYAIGEYSRYYFGYYADGHRMIEGELVVPYGSKEKPAGIYLVGSQRDFPTIFDGGCSVMHVVYDVDAGRLVSLKCNGVA